MKKNTGIILVLIFIGCLFTTSALLAAESNFAQNTKKKFSFSGAKETKTPQTQATRNVRPAPAQTQAPQSTESDLWGEQESESSESQSAVKKGTSGKQTSQAGQAITGGAAGKTAVLSPNPGRTTPAGAAGVNRPATAQILRAPRNPNSGIPKVPQNPNTSVPRAQTRQGK